MKVRSSVKPICEKCKVIKRKGNIMIICEILSISRDRDNSRLFMFGTPANLRLQWRTTRVSCQPL